MSAWVKHNISSLKLHCQVFRDLASGNLPFTIKDHLLEVSERYSNMVKAYPPMGSKVVIDVCDGEDLPTFDELIRLAELEKFPNIKTVWRLETSNGKYIAKNTLWGFYQAVKDIPNLPHGVFNWAAHAQPGDSATFYQSSTKRTFKLSMEEVKNA